MERNEELKEERKCLCPYCDGELSAVLPFCQACGITVLYCRECGQLLPRESKVCPHCGVEIEYTEDI